MQLQPIFLAIETAPSRSMPVNREKLLNLFVERQNPQAASQSPVFACPGIRLLGVQGSLPARGGWVFKGVAYMVLGTKLCTISPTGLITDVSGGEVIPGNGPVGMSDNSIQLGIVNGQSGWMYQPGIGLQEISSVNFYGANTITFMDGYFVFDRPGTNDFYLSDLYDGMSYSGNDTGVAEAQPGSLIACANNQQFLYLFTSTHIESWYNAGTANFPFQRYAGGVIPFGCIAPYSIVRQDGSLFFLGTDKVIYRLQGTNVLRVSSHEIETLIEGDRNLDLVEAQTYTFEGHKWINWTFPGLGLTLTYDLSTNKWHERESTNEAGQDLGIWRGRVVLPAYSKLLVGDAFDGRVGVIDRTLYTEYGNIMVGLIRSAPYAANRARVFCKALELWCQTGDGIRDDLTKEPQVMMRYSRDGGRTWSLQQKWRSLGLEGEYTRRLRWLRMGFAREWVWEFRITDPVPRTIIGAFGSLPVGLN